MESKSPALQQALQTEEVTSSTLDICKMDIDGDKQHISIAGWSSFPTNSQCAKESDADKHDYSKVLPVLDVLGQVGVITDHE